MITTEEATKIEDQDEPREWKVLAVLSQVEGASWSTMSAWAQLYQALSTSSEEGTKVVQMVDKGTGALVIYQA
jgi:hypothetical protein